MDRTALGLSTETVSLSLGQSKGIESVRVDNFTSQWLQIVGTFGFIAPYTFGAVMSVRGAGTVTINPAIPNGISAQAPVVANERYAVTVYDRELLPSPGQPLPGFNGNGVVMWHSTALATVITDALAGLSESTPVFKQIVISPLPTNTGLVQVWSGGVSRIFGSWQFVAPNGTQPMALSIAFTPNAGGTGVVNNLVFVPSVNNEGIMCAGVF